MKQIIQGVKGARDFYPENMAFRTWLYQVLSKISKQYGYQEYDGPFLEKIELYAAKSGEELVKEQSFVFPDRSGELITLRPELTPSLARMVAARQNDLVFPLKWWSFGPFWRYERPQKGRSREFFQWNIDLIGVNSNEADAEMLAVGCSFFKEVELTTKDVVISVNDRRLMEAEILGINIPRDSLQSVYKLIDKREKMDFENWKNFASEISLDDNQIQKLIAILNNKELWKNSPALVNTFKLVETMGFKEYIDFDPSIIRGLDYYTGIVFEARDKEGGRALFGGGRYNNLVGDVGGVTMGGVGFAMGDVVIRLTLEKYKKLPILDVVPANILVTSFDEECMQKSASIAAQMRLHGLLVECYPEVCKLQKQFKYADRKKIRYLLVIGPDEIANGKVTIKDMKNQSQEIIAEDELIKYFKEN